MTRNSRSTSSLSSTADGSSMTISRASWDSARAMLTICCAGGRQASRPPRSARISGWPSRASSSRAGAVRRGRSGEARAGTAPGRGRCCRRPSARRRGRAPGRSSRCRAASPPADRPATPSRRRQVIAALVGLVGAGEHLDQRRLAGAVLAEQAVHLTGADVEVDAVQRPDAGERLDDAVHLQQRCGHRTSPSRGAGTSVTSISRTFAQR